MALVEQKYITIQTAIAVNATSPDEHFRITTEKMLAYLADGWRVVSHSVCFSPSGWITMLVVERELPAAK
jgi:hypothetical protein